MPVVTPPHQTLTVVLAVCFTGCGGDQSATPPLSDYATGRNESITHTWHNRDGSRTHRYDAGGNTYYERQDAGSVKYESDLKQAAIALAIVGTLKAGEAIYDWWNAPTPPAETAPSTRKPPSQTFPFVLEVNEGSIAEAIGIEVGDTIVAYNGDKLDDETRTNDALSNAISSAPDGKMVEIFVYRDGDLYKTRIVGGHLLGIRFTARAAPWQND